MKQCKRCKGTGRIRPKGKTGPNKPFKIGGFIINPSKKDSGKVCTRCGGRGTV